MRREMHPVEPEELMAYLDGELAPPRAPEAARHLSDCAECQVLAAEFQSVSRRLSEWRIDEPGPDIERAVRAATPPEPNRPFWKRRAPWIAGLAAAGAAACVLLVLDVVPLGLHKEVPLPPSYAEERPSASPPASPPLPTAPQTAVPRVALAPPGATRMTAPMPVTAQPPAQFPRGSDYGLGWVRRPEPSVARTAKITLTVTDFTKARAALEDILRRRGGHIGELTVSSPADSGRTIEATLRVPAAQLDATLAEVRNLGRVESEQQKGEEVTEQVVDLDARLANSRITEQRLAAILRTSTGKISDVLEVEDAIDRVRGDIERMEAERKDLGDRIAYATLHVLINEEYKAHLNVSAPSTFTGLRNAFVDGWQNVADSLLGAGFLLLSFAPLLALWGAVLFFPARYIWRRWRKSRPQA